MVMDILRSPLFITILFTGVGVQLVKVVFYSIKHGGLYLKEFVATGGMPSSHSALVAGLSTIIYLTEGATSVFFVMLSLMFIVIVDAMGVRRTAGDEGMVLHELIKKSKLHIKEPHYALGHTPAQVSVGFVIGIVVSVLVYVWYVV